MTTLLTDPPKMRATLTRRVENFSLASTVPGNAMIPLFEAIYNSLQSIRDRFGDTTWGTEGRLSVTRVGRYPTSFVIEDNGEGLNQRNFESFQEYDSPKKRSLGGKGIGRLSWLKVFDHAEVDSVFLEGGKTYRRRFDFRLNDDEPFANYSLEEQTGAVPLRTSITLRDMKTAYEAHLPVKRETLISRIIGHFLAFLLADGAPEILYADDDGIASLHGFVKEHSEHLGDVSIDDDGDELVIGQTLLERALVDNRAEHLAHFAAGDRIVRTNDVGSAVGLATYVERNGKKYVYCAVISGPVLTSSVNTERTYFDLPPEKLERINRQVIGTAQATLTEDVDRIVGRQSNIVKAVVRKFPRYSYLVKDADTFARDNLPRSINKVESVYQQLAVLDFREIRRVDRELDSCDKGVGRRNRCSKYGRRLANSSKR